MRKRSLRASLAFAFGAAAVVITIALGYTAYRRTSGLVEADARDRLSDLLSVTAAGIDGEMHASIRGEADRGSPAHRKLVAWLEAVKASSPAIRFIYTQRRVGDRIHFIVDPDPTNPISTDYLEVTAGQLAHYGERGVYVEPELVRDQWGAWLSGTAPIRSGAGQDGVIGIDIDVDRLEEARYAQLWAIIIGCVVVGVAGVLFGVWFSGRVARPLVQVERELARLRTLELSHPFAIESGIREVANIGDAVVNMKRGLASFRKYVPADVVAELIHSNQEATLGAQRETLTILFSDIAGFTSVSEKLSPEQVVRLLERYLAGMSRVLVEHQCTIDKYIGDAVMGFWGAPKPVVDHEIKACRAALGCLAMLKRERAAWEADGFPAIHARIGIHTGEVVVGNIGFEERLSYTIIGDDVNLASRLEGTNKFFETSILVSDATLSKTKGEFATRILGEIIVKGRQGAVRVHELVATAKDVTAEQRAFLDRFNAAWNHYAAKNFAVAFADFAKCADLRPGDRTTEIYRERCKRLLGEPPGKDWVPALEMSDK